MSEKPTKTATLSEKHGKGRERKAKKSLALSVLLHGLLGASLVGVTFYAGSSDKPRRVFELTFGEREDAVELAVSEVEVLAPELVQPDESMVPEPSAEVWFDSPVPLPDTTLAEDSTLVSPVEDWADEQLVDDFQARDGEATLLPISITPTEPVDLGDPDGATDEEQLELAPDEESDEDPELATPKRIEGKDPAYPRLSSRLKEQGDVELRLTLDDEGRVRGVELVTTSGYSRLDEAAMSAAPKWRFDVTPEGVLRSFVHTVHFRLDR